MGPKTSKIEAQTLQNRARTGPRGVGPKTSKIEAQTFQNRAQTGPRGVQDDQKTEKQHTPNKKEGGAPQRTPILEENVANMAQVGLPNQSKIYKKSMQKSIKKWMPLGIDFGMDFGGFLVPK